MGKLEELIEKLCPNGVEYKTLDRVCSVSTGNQINKNKLLEEAEYPVINGGINPSGYWHEYNTEKNTITISQGGASAGFVNYMEYPFWAGAHCYVVKLEDNNINYKYLYHYIKSIENKLQQCQQGAGIPSVSRKTIYENCIPVPPMEVQCEIVRILDTLTLLSTELSVKLSMELNDRQKQYEYYRNKLINDCDGSKAKLIDLLSQPITDGPHTTPQLYPVGVPFISATAVYDGKIHLEDAKGFISKEFDIECSKKYKPQKHDVYMVKSGSTTGKVAYVDTDDDFNIWSPLAAMRTDNEVSSRFLFHLLQTTDIQNQVQSRMSHGSQPNLSMRVLEQFDIIIPSLDEQKRIVGILDKLDIIYKDICDGISAEIEKRQKQYEYYRDKLLSFKEAEVNE